MRMLMLQLKPRRSWACSGVMNLCAERVAALNMYVNSGQTRIKRLIAFRDEAPSGGGSGMPCGACREFLY